MKIPLIYNLFHKHQTVEWENINVRRDLLIDYTFKNREQLWGQVCYFLYKKQEPLFYQELCRYYNDDNTQR